MEEVHSKEDHLTKILIKNQNQNILVTANPRITIQKTL